MKPNIALLFAGGTIGMMTDPNTGALTPVHDAATLLQMIPGLQDRINLEVFHLFNIDSSNMNPTHWEQIAATIHEQYQRFDGFVVAQGTDTMAYSASAVSYALQNLGKPVIFTGSIVPMGELGADGMNNLIYACLVAGMDIAEVAIMFGNKILRGNRAKKNHESFVDVFHSPNFPLLGEVERPIRLFDWTKPRSTRTPKYQPGFDSQIGFVQLFPGFNPDQITQLVTSGIRGLIIAGFGPGNIPFMDNSVVPAIKIATAAGIPVIICSQMEQSVTNLQSYEAGYRALEAGAVSAHDMTTEACITKLMWVLTQTADANAVATIIENDIAGELSSGTVHNQSRQG